MIKLRVIEYKDRFHAMQEGRSIMSAMTEEELFERIREMTRPDTVLFYKGVSAIPYYSISTDGKETI